MVYAAPRNLALAMTTELGVMIFLLLSTSPTVDLVIRHADDKLRSISSLILHAEADCRVAWSSGGGGTGGVVALDALGNTVKESTWLAGHKKGDRSLAQGLKV